MVSPLVVLLIVLASSYIISTLFRQVGLPRVVGYLITGLVLGHYGSALFAGMTGNVISFLADLGVIFLFFYVGLEMDVRAFTNNLERGFLISALNTALPFLGGFLFMYGLGYDTFTNILVGAALAVSAQSVTADLLEELNMLKGRIGNIILSAGAVDDMLESVVIAAVLSMMHLATSKAKLAELGINIVLFLTFIVALHLWIIPIVLRLFDITRSRAARFTGAIVIVLLIATVAQWLGLGLLIGAIIAGMVTRHIIKKDMVVPDWEEHDIAQSIHTIAFGFLVPIFFVYAGVQTDISSALQDAPLILALVAITTIGSIVGTYVALRLTHGSWKESLVVAFGMNIKGDVEIVIASVALGAGLIAQHIFGAIVMMSLISTVLSALCFKWLALRYKFTHTR